MKAALFVLTLSLFTLKTTYAQSWSMTMDCSSGTCLTLKCLDDTCTATDISYGRRVVAVNIGPTHEFRMMPDRLYGFEDSLGNLIIPYQFATARPFVEGYAVVSEKRNCKNCCPSWSYHIRPDGTPLYPNRFCSVSDFVNGYAIVENTGRYDMWHIDTTGERIYPQTYLYLTSFSHAGYAIAMKESLFSASGVELWVLIDTQGKEIAEYRVREMEIAREYFQSLFSPQRMD